jgi:hypothetical protein
MVIPLDSEDSLSKANRVLKFQTKMAVSLSSSNSNSSITRVVPKDSIEISQLTKEIRES